MPSCAILFSFLKVSAVLFEGFQKVIKALTLLQDRGLDARQQMIDALKAQLNKSEPQSQRGKRSCRIRSDRK